METGQVDWSAAATTTSTTWTDYDITINTSSQMSIFYKITAVNMDDQESGYSNTVTTLGYWVPKIQSPSVVDNAILLPNATALLQNYPNPFNPETEIRFDLSRTFEGAVRLEILNVLGQPVRTLVAGHLPPGFHRRIWDGRDERGLRVASGIYFAKLIALPDDGREKLIAIRKMLLAQ